MDKFELRSILNFDKIMNTRTHMKDLQFRTESTCVEVESMLQID